MAFLNYGSVKGLSYAHDWQRDIDRLYERQRYAMEVRREKEEKARYYGELFQRKQVTTDYNTRRLETYYDELTQELAEFVIANPNFETDINLQRQFQDIAQRFQDNDIVREELQVNQNYEMLKEAVASGDYEEDDMLYEMDRYMDYAKNGGEPYMFHNFKRVDFNEMVYTLARQIQPEIQSYLDETGQEWWQASTFADERINKAILFAISNDSNKKALHRAWMNAGGPNSLYKSEMEFGKTMLKSLLADQYIFSGIDDRFILDSKQKSKAIEDAMGMAPIFMSNIGFPLHSSGRVEADPDNVIFTSAGDTGEMFNPWTQGKVAIKIKTKDDKGNDTYRLEQFEDLNRQLYVAGAGEIIMEPETGMKYVELRIKAAINDIMDDKSVLERLQKLGFSLDRISLTSDLSKALSDVYDLKNVSQVASGSIYVPFEYTYSDVNEYEKRKQGVSVSTKLHAAGYTGEEYQKFTKEDFESELVNPKSYTRVVKEANNEFTSEFPGVTPSWTKDVYNNYPVLTTTYNGEKYIFYKEGSRRVFARIKK